MKRTKSTAIMAAISGLPDHHRQVEQVAADQGQGMMGAHDSLPSTSGFARLVVFRHHVALGD